MIKKTFYSLLFLVLLLTNAYSAGSSSDGGDSSKVKSNYDKAVTLIKAAKKYEKKGKIEKANKRYEKAQALLIKSNKKKPHALITDPEEAKKHVLNMVKNQSLNCHSGKQIPCEIDSVCIHGDNESSLSTAKSIRENLIENGLQLKPLNQMKKFI